MIHPAKQYVLLLRLQFFSFFSQVSLSAQRWAQEAWLCASCVFWCHLFLWDNGWLFRCHCHCCWWQEITIFPDHLFSLPFPSDSPLTSNPVNFRNRKIDVLPAQVCWHMNWHVRSWAFLSQGASICIYMCMYMYMYIYLCVCVCLKHCKKWCYAVPALLWGSTNYSSVWDMPRPLADYLEVSCQVSKVWSFVSLDRWSQLLLNLEDSPLQAACQPAQWG